MEFKIIVRSREERAIERYISDVKRLRSVPNGAEMHMLRNFDGVDIVFYAEGYDPELYAALKRHCVYIANTVRTPGDVDYVGWV
ncbi:hypothetical protein Asfd1_113 [Aeromonas phage Asfd_1]|nr:hypothetical protein Asfd1_113 [Aeromonas phage Asfd_1]